MVTRDDTFSSFVPDSGNLRKSIAESHTSISIVQPFCRREYMWTQSVLVLKKTTNKQNNCLKNNFNENILEHLKNKH